MFIYQLHKLKKISNINFFFDRIERRKPRSRIRENLQIGKNNKGRGPAIEMANVPDNNYQDGMIADSAVQVVILYQN
jgi:hypothetical protein